MTVNTSGHVYDDFFRLFFLDEERGVSVLTGELLEDVQCVVDVP